ncbi:hypothetical protein F2Q70_00025077 [Brassica cretica]|uniref:Uncharacterized protein n=1 Tax=Brassica cretica TaxID=69181 RepID=A0A8S9L9V3_BRACR|nr:hypothetical protein F2Q70_00025077 [Brassica cretica]
MLLASNPNFDRSLESISFILFCSGQMLLRRRARATAVLGCEERQTQWRREKYRTAERLDIVMRFRSMVWKSSTRADFISGDSSMGSITCSVL